MSEDRPSPAKPCCAPARTKKAAAPPLEYRPGQGTSTTMVVEIPGGTGLVGTNTQHLPVDGEGPLRKAKTKPFRMEETTVTNASFAAFVAATDYVNEAERLGDSFVFHTHLSQAAVVASLGVAAVPLCRGGG